MSTRREYDSLADEAIGWIRTAGAIARERLGTVEVYRKEDRSPVTDADHAVQDAVMQAIARSCPGDAVISEETQANPQLHQPVASARRCWVIDPIDGTRNYARALPLFTVALALMEQGRPVIGLVHDPMTGRVYRATAGGGAWEGDRTLSIDRTVLSGSPFISIPTGRHEALPAIVHRWIDRMVVRNLGTTALHLALAADGALDLVYARRAKLWDVAAGALLIEEAGGCTVSLADGKPCFPMDLASYDNGEMPFLAGKPSVVKAMLEEYRQSGEAI